MRFRTQRLFASIPWSWASCALAFGREAGEQAAIAHDLRLAGAPIPTNDLWIAATAMQHGLLVLTLDVVDGREVAHTLQCPHWGGHFVSRRGSGARRTFCLRCLAVTYGNPACDPCIPFEIKTGGDGGKAAMAQSVEQWMSIRPTPATSRWQSCRSCQRPPWSWTMRSVRSE